MGSIWFFGFVAYLLGRTFYAGLRSKDLFYREPISSPYSHEVGPQFSEDKVTSYIARTVTVSLTWPLSLPLIGVFKLGNYFNKDK
jgi:hypothetical protein